MLSNFLRILSPLIGLAALASAQSISLSCPDALRYGRLSISPTTVAPGGTFTIVGNMTCANYLGYTPTYLDYYIQDTTNNNGYERPILIARHTYDQSANPPLDQFTAELPSGFWFDGAEYQLWMFNNYARVGPAGDTVISVGSVDVAINITGF
ncbi:hypothetical protein B0H11DRAFT_1706518 [Mycena galericulata]|nr:hypothetical protein B0H11DRAFT_1706518 [Mycena galericulata]